MRNFKIFSLMAVLLCGFFACTQAPESDKAVTTDAQEPAATGGETWNVDLAASSLAWIGTKVSARHSGDVKIKSGELNVDNGQVTGGKFVLDMASLQVTGPAGSDAGGNTKLQGHLTSPDFFDTAKYPDATFVITGVQPFTGTVADDNDPNQAEVSQYKVANPTHTVSGNLTVKGVEKGISFPARITVSGTTAEAMAKFNIDRTQWGIVYPGKPDDLIRNDIHIGLSLKASK